jgi:unsaturated rhamnogalacturonyl hydrolase
VLVIMENDPGNADLEHINLMAEQFGIHFNNVLRNKVDGNKFEMGKISIDGAGPIFHEPHSIFMKEICTIAVKPPASALLRDSGDILMATAHYGKGTVFATVDPWLYNEYTDGRKLPAEYDNYAAGKELVRWILAQIPREYSKAKPASSSNKTSAAHKN